MNKPRTLPIRVPPLPGEALDSWLEALAARLDTPIGLLLPALGLPRTRPNTAQPGTHGPPNLTVCLQPQEAEHLAAVTELDIATITSMTLFSYADSVVRIDRERREVQRHYLWCRGQGSRYCPDCLTNSQGRWQLAWRLTWSFACPAHRRMLVDRCPACDRTPRTQTSLEIVPRPGTCLLARRHHRGSRIPRCGADLTSVSSSSLAEDSAVLAAQARIDAVVQTRDMTGLSTFTDQPATVTGFLNDLKAIGGLVLAYATDEDLRDLVAENVLLEWHQHTTAAPATPPTRPAPVIRTRTGFMAPSTAAATAAALTAATHILTAPDLQEAATRIDWLLDRLITSGVDVTPTGWTRWGRYTSPALQTIFLRGLDRRLRPSDRLRYRTGGQRPNQTMLNSTLAVERAAKIPQQLWHGWAARLIPPTGMHFRSARQVLSASLLLVGTRTLRAESLALLGSELRGTAISHLLRKLKATPYWSSIAFALSRLAEDLDAHGSPIDYARRRRVFQAQDLLTPERWQALNHAAGGTIHPGKDRRLLHARQWISETLTGSGIETAGILRSSRDISAYLRFREELNPQQATVLREFATELLHRKGIHEPLTWEPAPAWIAAHPWPFPAPGDGAHDKLRALITEGFSVHAVAERLGTTIEHVRLVLDQQPVRRAYHQRQQTPDSRYLDQMRSWYEEGWSAQRIAAELGISRTEVGRRLHALGVTMRPPGRHPKRAKNALERSARLA